MSDAPLSASGEAAWQSLRQHIEWTPGFWIGWLFTDHTPSVHELHQRISAQLRSVNRSTTIRQPREPDELAATLMWLLAGAEGFDGCAVVAVVQSGQVWRDAWDHFMLRLNERRELLRQHLRCGLLLCAPTSFKPRTREAAPDLWSIRSLALDVGPVAHSGQNSRLSLRDAVHSEGTEAAASITLALQAVDAAQRAGQTEAEVDARLRAADMLFDAGRRDEGREQAVHAVQVASTLTSRARALANLAKIEERLEDVVASERHYHAAIETDAQALEAIDYRRYSDLLENRGALEDALQAARAALEKSLKGGAGVDTQASVRDQALSLQRIGDVKRLQDNLDEAETYYLESLGLTRELQELTDDSTLSIRDEAVTLERLGLVKEGRGDLSAARESYEESLRLARQIRISVGDTAQTLQDEAIYLCAVGDTMQAQGELTGANDAYNKSLSLIRKISILGKNGSENLDLEAFVLRRIGRLKSTLGDFNEGRKAYRASLDLQKKLRAKKGDNQTNLYDEALTLARLGALLAVDEESEARDAYEASLALSRRLQSIVGDTPSVLQLIAQILGQSAETYRREPGGKRAHENLTEAVALWRELYRRNRSRRNARSLAQALDELADLLREEAEALRAAADE